jgi:hypothetical protein
MTLLLGSAFADFKTRRWRHHELLLAQLVFPLKAMVNYRTAGAKQEKLCKQRDHQHTTFVKSVLYMFRLQPYDVPKSNNTNLSKNLFKQKL